MFYGLLGCIYGRTFIQLITNGSNNYRVQGDNIDQKEVKKKKVLLYVL